MTRLTRDNHLVSVGAIRKGPTAAELVARNLATLLIVPAAILIVWWAVGSGFRTSVPVQVEEDDGPNSEVMP